jgi:hypothetical protein
MSTLIGNWSDRSSLSLFYVQLFDRALVEDNDALDISVVFLVQHGLDSALQ